MIRRKLILLLMAIANANPTCGECWELNVENNVCRPKKDKLSLACNSAFFTMDIDECVYGAGKKVIIGTCERDPSGNTVFYDDCGVTSSIINNTRIYTTEIQENSEYTTYPEVDLTCRVSLSTEEDGSFHRFKLAARFDSEYAQANVSYDYKESFPEQLLSLNIDNDGPISSGDLAKFTISSSAPFDGYALAISSCQLKSLGESQKFVDFFVRDENDDISTKLDAVITPSGHAEVVEGSLFQGVVIDVHFQGDSPDTIHEIECEMMVLVPWNEWSECSATCGGGSRSRSKSDGTTEDEICNPESCISDLKMVASQDMLVEGNLLTRVGPKGARTVVSENALPSSGVFNFEIEFLNIGQIRENYAGVTFGISSSEHPIPDGKWWDVSAIMFEMYSPWKGGLYVPNKSNPNNMDYKSNFMSITSPWRDGDRAGVSINIDTNEIGWYYKGDAIWTVNTKEEFNFEIGDKFHPTVTMYNPDMQVRVYLNGPFENF